MAKKKKKHSRDTYVNDCERTEGSEERRVAEEAIFLSVTMLVYWYSCTKTKTKEELTKKYGTEIQHKNLRNVQLKCSDITVQMNSKKNKM
jgi:hypothetical protein